MKIEVVFLVVALCCLSASGFGGEDKKDMPSSSEQCAALEFIHQRISCLTKLIIVQNDATVKKDSFDLLMTYWCNKDGEAGYSLSNAFLEIVEQEPALFFEQMKRDINSYNQWLGELSDLSFTWHSDSPSPLPQKRERLINIVRKYKPDNEDLSVLRDKFLVKLESIVPSQIE